MNSIWEIDFDAVTCATVLARMGSNDLIAPNPIREEACIVMGTGPSRFYGFLAHDDLEEFDLFEGLIKWRFVSPNKNQTSARSFRRPSKDTLRGPQTQAAWVKALYSLSAEEITDDAISEMFDALEVAVYDGIGNLDGTLAQIDVTKLAPEFLVGIPRGLYPLRDRLSHWNILLTRIWNELSRRPGLDVKELMQGLL